LINDIIYINYIIHFIIGEGVMDAPKLGFTNDLTKMYLQQSKIHISRDISSHHRSCIQMENVVNIALM